jgi:hypothetical protein
LATQTTIEKLKADVEEATAARRRLVEAEAAGETVKPETLHAAAAALQKLEAELSHAVEVLAIQHDNRLAADKGRLEANGLAQAPIIHHALRELRDIGVESADLQSRLHRLSVREHEARQAIMDCFGRGLKIPSPIAPRPGSFWGGLPKGNGESIIRAAYGEYALAAFGPLTDEPAEAA